MEFPEPWHRYDTENWPRLQQAICRLNFLRRRKGLPPLDSRPPLRASRLDGEVEGLRQSENYAAPKPEAR